MKTTAAAVGRVSFATSGDSVCSRCGAPAAVVVVMVLLGGSHLRDGGPVSGLMQPMPDVAEVVAFWSGATAVRAAKQCTFDPVTFAY